MKKRIAQVKSVPSFVMFATIFVAVTIPLVVMSLSGEESFDIRNRAYETVSPTTTNPCVIYFPKVNPETLQVNGSYKVSVEAISSVKDIEGIKIVDGDGNTLFEKEYTSLVNTVGETFTYTPSKTGTDFIRGSLIKVTGEEACSGDAVTIKIKNNAPEITSEEKDSNISVGDDFEYTIVANDLDGDIVNYSYSFTPRADWLKKTVIEDGSDGSVKIKLQGTPDAPASYLAHIFVHDGYGNHLDSMSWIISVNQDENDIPVIKILTPSENISLNVGEKVLTKWLANDQNQIVKYQIYISEDPTNSDSWNSINEDISYKTREYNVNTSGLTNGIYRIIVRALDNQDPQGIGFAISPEINIGGGKDSKPTDDIVLVKPQIINVTPNNSAEVENPRPIIRATLIAGTDATISEASILFKLNDREVTEGIRLNKISDKEITFIYQPEQDLSPGIQKITLSFDDTNENNSLKEWTFTVIDTTPEVNTDVFVVFGIEISRKMALIIGAGIAVVLLAIVVPIIIYNMWSKDSGVNSNIINKELPPKIPTSGGMYELKENVNEIPEETIIPVEKETDSRFSTPSLEDLDGESKVEEGTNIEQPVEEIIAEEKEEPLNEDVWKPQIITPAEEETEKEVLPVQETITDTPKEEETAEDTTSNTVIPDLAIPSPDTFTEEPIPVSDKSIDEITQLYEEIQKVEDEENPDQPQNS